MRDLDKKAKEIALSMHPPSSQEEHKKRIEKSMIMQCREQDELWMALGEQFDQEVFYESLKTSGIQKDPEF